MRSFNPNPKTLTHHQLIPGNTHFGKWFVSQGIGVNIRYLRTDLTWHRDDSSGEFYFDTREDAEAVKTARETADDQEPAPPP